LELIIKNKIREIWIDEHHRALIIPLTSGLNIVSIDVYFRKWVFPVTEKVSLDNETLIYYKTEEPKEVGIKSFLDRVVRVEIIGHLGEGISETISIRAWVKGENDLEKIVKAIYSEVTRNIRGSEKQVSKSVG